MKLSKQKTIFVFSATFFFISLSFCNAQFNIKVGYNGMYGKMNGLNGLFADYNKAKPTLTNQFGNIRFLHGIEVGMRYKFAKGTAVELTWLNHQSVNNKASGLNNTGTFFEDKWKLSSTEYSLGLENYYGNYGFGATIGPRSYKYLQTVPGAKNKVAIMNESVLNSRFYLILHVQTGRSGFAIKPYYQVAWKQLDLQAVDSRLTGQNRTILEDYNAFGLNLVFYNGQQ